MRRPIGGAGGAPEYDDEQTADLSESRQQVYSRLLAMNGRAATMADTKLPESARGSLLWATVFVLAEPPDRRGFMPELHGAEMYALADHIIRELRVPHRRGAGEEAVETFANSLSGMRSQHAEGKPTGYGVFKSLGPNRIGLA